MEYLDSKLKEKGLDVWFDRESTTPGDHTLCTWEEIEPCIRSCTLFVCILSPGYFRSHMCKDEFKTAHEANKRFFPIQWKNDNHFKYPDKYADQYSSILRYKYDADAVIPEAEKARCAKKIIESINGQ